MVTEGSFAKLLKDCNPFLGCMGYLYTPFLRLSKVRGLFSFYNQSLARYLTTG
jgi:hypothetical protein